MAINDTYFFTAIGTLQGQSYIHTLHFREGASATGSPVEQHLINLWQSGCQAPWLAAHGASYTLSTLRAQKVCGSLPLPSAVEESVGAVGTRSVTLEHPPWLACVVQERTGFAGKSYRGRFYMSGFGEGDVTNETFVAGGLEYIGKVQAYADALDTTFMDKIAPFDWQLVVHSRTLAQAVPPPQCTASSSPVTSLNVVTRLTTLRSRRA